MSYKRWNQWTLRRRLCGLFQPYAVGDWTGKGGYVTVFTTRRRALACGRHHNLDVARLDLRMRTGLTMGYDIRKHLTPVHGEWDESWAG